MSGSARAAGRTLWGFPPLLWLRIGMAIKSALGEAGLYAVGRLEPLERLLPRDRCTQHLALAPRRGRITLGTLFFEAERHGHVQNRSGKAIRPAAARFQRKCSRGAQGRNDAPPRSARIATRRRSTGQPASRRAAATHLFFNVLSVPAVDLDSPFASPAGLRCRGTVVRAFPPGWDWSANQRCAPRRQTRSTTRAGGRRKRPCIAWCGNISNVPRPGRSRGAASLPQFVKDEFDAFLECGILAHGFLRLRCAGCAHEKLVAFSCKRRGFCPPAARGAWRRAPPGWSIASSRACR